MERGNTILKLRRIHKSFSGHNGELKVLQDISFQVCAGEIIALIGPSGCGKTTLMSIIAGLIEPDQGEVMREAGLRLAYVFQEPRLLPWKTVEANVSFVQRNFLQQSEAEAIKSDLLRRAGLAEYRDAYPGQLSGGMKQRLELVRALSVKPELLLMDEPFKSLDLALQHQLRELLLTEHARAGFAVLLITHDPEEAVMLADRVLVLSDKPSAVHEEIVIDVPLRERSRKDGEIFAKAEQITDYLLS